MKRIDGLFAGVLGLILAAGIVSGQAAAASLDNDATAALNALYKRYPAADELPFCPGWRGKDVSCAKDRYTREVPG